MKCFKGHLCLQYHPKKAWGLKCDTCHFRVGLLEGAARVVKEEGPEGKCPECDSWMLNATFKQGEERTPFPGNARSHSGCVLCDTTMRGTIINFFAKRQPKRAFEDMNEEERKAYEEVRRKKEEKKKKREEEAAKGGSSANGEKKEAAAAGGKKKKQKGPGKGPNMLTAEEMMNDFIKKQFGGQ
jgi:hypothetical protein